MAGSGTGTPVTATPGITSGSFDFTVDTVEIIDAALRVLGVLREGDSSANHAYMYQNSLEALNLMLKNWQSLGLQLWTRKQTTIDLTANKQSYSWVESGDIKLPTALRVVSAFRRDSSNIDAPLVMITRDEYDRLSNKQASGTPTQLFYDYQDSIGYLYPWPVPNAAGTNIVATYHEPFDDMDNSTDRLDFPQTWWEAVKYNLALRIADEYGQVPSQSTVMLAAMTLENAKAASYEEGSTFFTPSPFMRYR